MPSVTKSIDVSATPEDAFAVAGDPARFEDWLTLHDRWVGDAPASTDAGTTFSQVLKIMGMPSQIDWTVEEREATKVTITGAGPMGAQLRTTIETMPSDGGSTVSYYAEFSGGGIQGPMGDMVTKKAGEEAELSPEKLKALVG
jgi:carbon monoxide dehydrogenase subunit G